MSNLSDMKQESTNVVVARPKGTGFETGKPLSEMTKEELLNAAANAGGVDPLAGHFITEAQAKKQAANGSISLSGIASQEEFVVGDRVYHQLAKSEGSIKRFESTKIAIVALDNGKSGKANVANLVKLKNGAK